MNNIKVIEHADEFNLVVLQQAKEGDYDTANQMLTLSLGISEMMEKARQQNGIVFDNDKEIL